MELLSNPDVWIAFLTLCALEIVLGIDNIIFISILTSRLPQEQQAKARQIGLSLAMIMRVGLLFSISWLMQLTAPLFTVAGNELSGRDLILLLGGLFLMYKSVKEIHAKVEDADKTNEKGKKLSFSSVITQIILVDLIFSLDSVITAVGMVEHIEVMIAAVVVSVGVMMLAAAPISNFVNRHPAVKILALAFLIMIGVALVGESLDFHIPKGYIYFAMAFSVAVEFINIRIKSRP
ncbi:MAG TPA: TerC family protein [Saprospiraceae bacterium]|nr:TerC family protein [Saprospiraceae bacterium]